MSGEAFKGLDFILEVNTGTTGIPIWTKICGLTQTGLTINQEGVDITDNCSEGWREMLEGAGIRNVSISASGNARDTAGQQWILSKILANEFVEARIRRGYGDEFSGFWQIPSNGYSAPYNSAETFEVTLESAGEITYTPAILS
jgi:TP901-1 family phage major tail protein